MRQSKLRSGRAILFAYLLCAASLARAAGPVSLEQNWDRDDREWFYHVNQGSRLLPYAVFLHLEAPQGSTLLRAPEQMARYGFLPSPVGRYNPDGLPLGFARDGLEAGLTCAACHTGRIDYNGRQIRIDGGQAVIDHQRFLQDLQRALQATLEDQLRRERFIAAVRRTHRLAANGAIELLQRSHARIVAENERNNANLAYGFGRLDAFGAILNKGLSLTGVPGNHNPPNAPTSYPHLWDTPQHDWVEWNGSSPNPIDGSLGRNIGEVIGVYGEVDVETAKVLGVADAGYRSSIKARTLRRIEKHVAALQSPEWPGSILPPIDRALAAEGAPLYARYCGYCHLDIDRANPARKVQVRMSSLAEAGTDVAMAESAARAQGKSGRFEGRTRFYFAGAVLGPEAPALYIVNHVMVGVVLNNPLQAWLAARDAKRFGHGEERHPPKYLDGEIMARGTETSPRALAAYKARPLNGIWASPPYLHNGSVPTLYDLMLPAHARPSTFYLGNWEFNPVEVGYLDHPIDGGFLFDTSLPGNRNTGHEYGTGADNLPVLTRAQIRAVVEYLKTL